MDRKPSIIKYLKFTVASSGKNDYGDLIVTSKYGCDYKISNKRTNLFDIFQPETAVVVGYSSYMNKDYIAVAHPADQFPAVTHYEVETPPQKHPQEVSSQATESKSEGIKAERQQDIPAPPIPGQQIGMTVKEIGDMIRANQLTKIFGHPADFNLVKWYRGQILGTTRIEFDGTKLPQFEGKEV
jgi:hypothetical protein